MVVVYASAGSGDDRAERIECRGLSSGTPAAQIHARRDEQLTTHTPAGADAKWKQRGLKVQTAKRQSNEDWRRQRRQARGERIRKRRSSSEPLARAEPDTPLIRRTGRTTDEASTSEGCELMNVSQ